MYENVPHLFKMEAPNIHCSTVHCMNEVGKGLMDE